MPSSTPPATRPLPPPEDCEYSVPTWKDVPSTWDVFFSVRCPYRAPENPVAAYLWRKRVWFEVTFALSMMEPWEKLLLVFVLASVSLLMSYAATTYLPHHVHFLLSRAKYYLLGTDLPITVTTTTDSTASVDSGVYGLGVIGDYAYGGIEKLGEFVATWKSWNGTAGVAQ